MFTGEKVSSGSEVLWCWMLSSAQSVLWCEPQLLYGDKVVSTPRLCSNDKIQDHNSWRGNIFSPFYWVSIFSNGWAAKVLNGCKLSNISGRIPLHSLGFIHKEETLKATKVAEIENGNCYVWPDTGMAVAMNPALTNKWCSGDLCTKLGKASIELEGGST